MSNDTAPAQTNTADEWITAQAAAIRMKRSRQWVYALARRRQIRTCKKYGVTVFNAADVAIHAEALMQNQFIA